MDDCKFYEKILNEYENDGHLINVFKVDVQDACEKGGNFVSKVERVILYGQKGSRDFQTSLILKRISNDVLTKTFKFDKVFSNEIIFYQEVLPKFLSHSKQMLETPKCLYVSDFFIYEDLNQCGYQLKPKGHRFCIEETKLVLREISKLHAASLSLQQNEPETFECLKEKLYYYMNKNENEALEKCYEDHLNTAINVFESEQNFEVASILKSCKSNIYRKIIDLFEKPTDIKVFNHGDLWGNNIFFKNDQIKIIDFQMMYIGSPAIDLTYFLWVNVDPTLRKQNLKEFLGYYIENLKKFSIENNVNEQIVDRFTLEWIENEMNVFSLFGLIYSLIFLVLFNMKPEDFMQETGEYENKAEEWVKNMNEPYKKTLIELVLQFIDIYRKT